VRLDELHGTIIEAFEQGAPADYAVKVSIDGNVFHIDRAELQSDGSFMIRLEI
jgi:hypothetical protein